MGLEIPPVVFRCNNEELIRRVESEEKYQEGKVTDSDFAVKRIRGKRLFTPKGSLAIDNLNLNAEAVAERIVKRMNNGKS